MDDIERRHLESLRKDVNGLINVVIHLAAAVEELATAFMSSESGFVSWGFIEDSDALVDDRPGVIRESQES